MVDLNLRGLKFKTSLKGKLLPVQLLGSLNCIFCLMLILLGVGCTSIKAPQFVSPNLHFNPLPNEITPIEEVSDDEGSSSALLGFFTPLDVKTEFDWPVDKARLTRGFLPYARPRPHLGLDLAHRRGSPIFAAQDGLVIYAGTGFRGYGRFVIIEHNDDWASFYGHLDKIVIKQGATVKKGDLIGKMGRSGRATGTHLHFEIRHEKKAIDPIAFLPQSNDWVKPN